MTLNAKFTPIKDISPMVMNMRIRGRVILKWHAHKPNQAHEPYSLELVLQVEEGNRIQVYIKKDWMFRFEPLLQDGICYVILNFGVTENDGKFPLLPHAWKMSFYKNINVTRVDQINDNLIGFRNKPFTRILDTNEEYEENNYVDVIGTVIGIGDVVAVNFIGERTILRTIVHGDEEKQSVSSMQLFIASNTKAGGHTSVVKYVAKKLFHLLLRGHPLLRLNRHGGVKSKKVKTKLLLAMTLNAKFTPIKDISPMVMNMRIRGRVILKWHAHKLNQVHEPYSLELVLQVWEVYIKKDWMFRFEPLLQDGICYVILNFGVMENDEKLPLLPHAWKMSFYKNINVTRVDKINDNLIGFRNKPFSRILDTNEEYEENNYVDVIGTVIGIGDVVAVNFIGERTILRTIFHGDEEGERIELTFWDSWAKK
nr:hypothetical protein [Tanacetum cinerariifolium]